MTILEQFLSIVVFYQKKNVLQQITLENQLRMIFTDFLHVFSYFFSFIKQIG